MFAKVSLTLFVSNQLISEFGCAEVAAFNFFFNEYSLWYVFEGTLHR